MSEAEKVKSKSIRLWKCLVETRCAELHERLAARADLILRSDRELDGQALAHTQPAQHSGTRSQARNHTSPRGRRGLPFPI